jgi:phosphatidylglycerol:prolipoprotein diacylglycerol transferase
VKVPGMIFFIYLILNGFERFWIEKIRVNEVYDSLPFQPTQAEIIAVILFIIGVAGAIWRKRTYTPA